MVHVWAQRVHLFHETRRPSTSRGDNQVEYVSELIDTSTNNWDVQRVRQTFCQRDAEGIFRIPIYSNIDDHIAWHYDTRGIFSVKSAYKILDLANNSERQAGTTGGERGSAMCIGEECVEASLEVGLPA
jgi:hypothetical protein